MNPENPNSEQPKIQKNQTIDTLVLTHPPENPGKQCIHSVGRQCTPGKTESIITTDALTCWIHKRTNVLDPNAPTRLEKFQFPIK